MDEIIAGILKFSPLIGAVLVPSVGLWLKIRNEQQDPSAVRALKQHAKLREELPEGSRAPIEKLITFEAEKYAAERIRRGTRKLNWGGFAALLIMAFLVGMVMAALIAWAMAWWPAFILVVPSAILFGAGLAETGSQHVFKYDQPPTESEPDLEAITAPVPASQ